MDNPVRPPGSGYLLAGHALEQSPSSPVEDTVGAKLAREAYVLRTGLSAGISESCQDAWNNPLQSGLKIGGGAAIALGLSALQARAGFGRLAVQVVGAGLAYGFLADVVGRGRVTAGALYDTWKSDQNLEANSRIVGKTLGPFAVDTALFGAGGLCGVVGQRSIASVLSRRSPVAPLIAEGPVSGGTRNSLLSGDQPRSLTEVERTFAGRDAEGVPTFSVAERGIVPRLDVVPRTSPDWNVYKQCRESVLRVRGEDGSFGTAFVLEKDGLLATADHVVRGHTPMYSEHNFPRLWVDLADGSSVPARILVRDLHADLALIKIDPGPRTLPPLRLAETSTGIRPGETLFALGHPQKIEQTLLTKGQYVNHYAGVAENKYGIAVRKAELQALEFRPIARIGTEITASGGNSGGPIVAESGDVVGMVTWKRDPIGASGTTIEHLRTLMELWKKAPAETVQLIETRGVVSWARDNGFKVRIDDVTPVAPLSAAPDASKGILYQFRGRKLTLEELVKAVKSS